MHTSEASDALISDHIEMGTEDQARELYGDPRVDDYFRSIGWDPDAARAEELEEP